MSSLVPAGMTLKETRRWMAADAQKYGDAFVEMPVEGVKRPPGLLRALRNRRFLVQIYEPEPHQLAQVELRISVNFAVLNDKGEWLDGITWDQLQAIKAALGFADRDAVEVYQRAGKLVNVAAIRHLWVVRKNLSWKWGGE